MFDESREFLARASEAMRKALRAAGATMPDRDLMAVAAAYPAGGLTRADRTDALGVRDVGAVRDYAGKYRAPLVW